MPSIQMSAAMCSFGNPAVNSQSPRRLIVTRRLYNTKRLAAFTRDIAPSAICFCYNIVMWFRHKKQDGLIKAPFAIVSLAAISILSASLLFAPTTAAFDLSISDGANAARGIDQATSLFGNTGIFTTISNVMLFVIGAISVVMVVIGGLRYVISGGNTTNVGAAKNTILYAIVGLIISLLAYAIINFVIGSFIPGGEVGGTDL